MKNCCVLFFALLILGGCCAGLASANDCEWLLMVPGQETRTVQVWPGAGNHWIAVGENALVIWHEGSPDAVVRFGGYAYTGEVGISYPEDYCGAVMLRITGDLNVW